MALDPDILQQEEEDLQRTLKRYYIPCLGNMEYHREEGVFWIMGRQSNSLGGKEVRMVKVEEIARIVEDWEVQGGCLSKVGINWAQRRYGDCLHDWLRGKFEDI